MFNKNQTLSLQQALLDALNTQTPVQIIGGGSKLFYARKTQGKALNITSHQGIINYHPSELVLTARTGTSLSLIEKILAEQGQMLAFEPPYFSPTATLGGAIACGFSGARRPFTGSVRDFVLGCKILNGKAEVLSFGGEVMKNVAGYDVSRLMVGAMGTLGLLLEVSLKVLPKPKIDKTWVLELNTNNALTQMSALARKSLPLSGLSFEDNLLYIRLSGSEKTIQAASQKIGGEELTNSQLFWHSTKEHDHCFFDKSMNLWRLSVPPATPPLALSGQWFYEWGGAQRWLKTTEAPQTIFAVAEKGEGYATLFRQPDNRCEIFQAEMPEVLKKLHKNIKTAFDPHGIFNPYRLCREW